MTQGDQVLICALAHVDLVELVGYSAEAVLACIALRLWANSLCLVFYLIKECKPTMSMSQ